MDFAQHAGLALSVAAGHLPSIQSAALYADAQLYLGLVVALFGHPYTSVRMAMYVLAFVSPVVCYLSVKPLIGKKAAWTFALLWTLSGVIWWPMVIGVGLFPNFFGVLAALMLLGATKAAMDDLSPKKAGVLGLVLLFALFSHYSVLTLFPALVVWALLKKRFALAGLLSLPLLLGVALVGYQTLLGFAQGGTATGYPPATALSALTPSALFASMVAVQSSDLGAVLIGLAAAIAILRLLGRPQRTEATAIGVMLAWLITVFVVSPDVGAWRFGLVALVPVLILASVEVSKHRLAAPYLVLAIALGGFVVHPWTPAGIAWDAMDSPREVQSYLSQVSQAGAWMEAHPGNYTSPTEWRFAFFGASYSPHEQGNPALLMNRTDGYVIVTTLVSDPAGCYSYRGGRLGYGECDPWTWSPGDLGGAVRVFQDANVTIWSR